MPIKTEFMCFAQLLYFGIWPLMWGLIPLLLQIPQIITVLSNAQETWGLSAPKTCLSINSVSIFTVSYSQVGEPQTTPFRPPVCTSAKWSHQRAVQRGSLRLKKSSVNKALIFQARSVQRGNISHLTSLRSWLGQALCEVFHCQMTYENVTHSNVQH